MKRRSRGWLALLCGCGGETPPTPALVPEGYAETFRQVRDCRRSADHDLAYVRVLADEVAWSAYTTRAAPLPAGSLLVKEEHADDTCTDLVGYTVMLREEPGWFPDGGDFHWQRLDAERSVLDDGKLARCAGCHALCREPDGFDWTCAVE